MKGRWALAVALVSTLILSGPTAGTAADSGGYGAPAPAPSSGGYGAPAPAPASGGYGAPAPEPSSGGYGAPAPAPASGGYGAPAPEPASGGYGAPAPEPASGGYGAPAPEPAAASGGYGSSAPAEEPAASGGYGSPAPADKPAASGGYGSSAPADKPAAEESKPAAASGGYGSSEEAAAPATSAPAPAAVPAAAPPAQRPARPGIPAAGFGFLLSSILCGLAMGWVLQRGRFCMNTAFRDTIFIKEFVTLRAYLIALIVTIAGANLLNDLGAISLMPQPFWPIAHILGGWTFGVGMVLAGGCGSGIWYRVGEGQLASIIAVVGFFCGIALTQDGLLSPFYRWARSYMVMPGGKPLMLHSLFGGALLAKWVIIAVIAVVIYFAIRAEKPFALKKGKGYYWSVTGLLIGIIAVVSFWASYKFGGFTRGLSFTTPTRELFFTLFTTESRSTIFPNYSLGFLKITWGIPFIIGVPLGAYLSCRGLKEFAWKTPRDPKELLTVMVGSLLMGFGGTLAVGCNIGQGLTGLSTLSVGSLFAALAIVLGNWTMVYFKFIKPMKDMDL